LIFEKIFGIMDKLSKETEFKIRKMKRKYTFIKVENMVIILLLVVFSFLISGGMASIYTGSSRQLIMVGYSGMQTYTELLIYFIVHIAYVVSLYMVYLSLKRTNIDISLLSIGIIMFLGLLFVEWYLIAFVRGVPI
jgi:hypothetical protein